MSPSVVELTVLREATERAADEISRHWLVAMQAPHKLQLTKTASKSPLIDCMPLVLRDIMRVAEPEYHKTKSLLIVHAAHHGRARASQHFDVTELLREYHLLRQQIFLHLQEHREDFEVDSESALLTIYSRLGLAVDQSTSASINAFVEERTGELLHLSCTDSLTGLYNHRTFYERLEEELKRAARYCSALSIALVDLNNFKEVNDIEGHQFGDRLLVKCAQALREVMRNTDLVCRYGGDEFGIIIPETSSRDAAALMLRVREAFVKLGGAEGAPSSFGMSFGIATYPESNGPASDFVRVADKRLIATKQTRQTR